MLHTLCSRWWCFFYWWVNRRRLRSAPVLQSRLGTEHWAVRRQDDLQRTRSHSQQVAHQQVVEQVQALVVDLGLYPSLHGTEASSDSVAEKIDQRNSSNTHHRVRDRE